MPRYFFDVHDGNDLTRDVEGSELADREAARQEGLAVIAALAKDRLPRSDRQNLYINVRNEAGAPIYTAGVAVIGRWLD